MVLVDCMLLVLERNKVDCCRLAGIKFKFPSVSLLQRVSGLVRGTVVLMILVALSWVDTGVLVDLLSRGTKTVLVELVE